MFSKAAHSTSPKRFTPLVNYVLRAKLSIPPQQRAFQSPKVTRETEGALDKVIGAYADPRYKLDLKPYEFRDGQYKTYSTHHKPLWIIYGMGSLAVFWGICCLTFFTMFDSQVNVNTADNMQCLRITSGRDYEKIRNPWFTQYIRFGNNWNLRTIFYNEIEDAIQRRQEMDKIYNEQDERGFEFFKADARNILQKKQ